MVVGRKENVVGKNEEEVMRLLVLRTLLKV